MAITLVEGFKYAPDSTRVSLDNSIDNNVPTNPVWARATGRGGRYGVSWSSDNATGCGEILLPNPGDGAEFSLAFAAEGVAGDGTDSLHTSPGLRIHVNQGDRDLTYSHAWDFSSGKPVIEMQDASGTSDWISADVSTTSEGWHWWCVTCKLGVSSGGYIRIWRDDVFMGSLEGDADATYGYNQIGIRMGNPLGTMAYFATISDVVCRDDGLQITDSRVDVVTLASTTAAGWTGSDADQIDNHLLLNDTGPAVDTATYVEAGSTGLADTYTLSALPSEVTDNISAVAVTLHGGSADAALPTTPSVNGDDGSASSPIAGSIAQQIWEQNPVGPAAWGKASVEAATIGIAT